jgi:hypothetical protein
LIVNSNVAVTSNGAAYAVDYSRYTNDLYLVEGLK